MEFDEPQNLVRSCSPLEFAAADAADTSTSLPSINHEVELARRANSFKADRESKMNLQSQSRYRTVSLAIVETQTFKNLMSCAILLNVVELGTSTDIYSDPWKDVWFIFDNVFAAVFAAEMFLKLAAFGFRVYFSNRSNLFDFCLAWLGMIDMWVLHVFLSGESLNMFGVLRTFRLLRLLRVLKVLTIQRQLMVVIEGIAASLSSMFWIGLLLSVFIYMFAIFCVIMVGRAENSHPNKEQLFGNIPRSMLSLFNITLLTEWPSIVWPLFEAQGWIVPIFVVFVIFASCGVLNVIIGVIVERTNQAGSKVREEDIRKHKQKQLDIACVLADLMDELDKNGDMQLTFKELAAGMEGGTFYEMLDGLDMPCGFTLWHLFTMLDEDSDGCLNPKEFVEGMRRIIMNNDFQRHCVVQCSVAQTRRQVKKAQMQILHQVRQCTNEVLQELKAVQRHLGVEPAAPAAKDYSMQEKWRNSSDDATADLGSGDLGSLRSSEENHRIDGSAKKTPSNENLGRAKERSRYLSEAAQRVFCEVTEAVEGYPVGGACKGNAVSSTAPAPATLPPLPHEPLTGWHDGPNGNSAFARGVRSTAKAQAARRQSVECPLLTRGLGEEASHRNNKVEYSSFGDFRTHLPVEAGLEHLHNRRGSHASVGLETTGTLEQFVAVGHLGDPMREGEEVDAQFRRDAQGRRLSRV